MAQRVYLLGGDVGVNKNFFCTSITMDLLTPDKESGSFVRSGIFHKRMHLPASGIGNHAQAFLDGGINFRFLQQ
jgi:hypothetical protein